MKCENCNDEHNGKYGSGRFCTSKCARGFSTKSKRKEINKKVSKKLKGKLISCNRIKKFPNRMKNSTKLVFHEITGEICNKQNKNKSYWIKNARARFTKKLCKWFDIPLGKFPDTINQLENLREYIRVLYEDKKFSSLDIKQHLNIPLPDGHMPAFVKQLKIKRRTLSEALTNYVERHGVQHFKSNVYKCGWHIGWDKTKHYYRSSYELIFYKFLDNKKIPYLTEVIRIKYFNVKENRMRIAIPDVLIKNMLIEVKSNYTYNKEEMIDKFLSYKKLGFKPILLLEGKFYRYLK